LQNFPKVVIEELPANFTRDAKMQEINIEGLQSHLKGKGLKFWIKFTMRNISNASTIYCHWVSKFNPSLYAHLFYLAPFSMKFIPIACIAIIEHNLIWEDLNFYKLYSSF
jgi:hypothetical protein